MQVRECPEFAVAPVVLGSASCSYWGYGITPYRRSLARERTSSERGQGGERGRAWPVAGLAFCRPPACGVVGVHVCEPFQQLHAKIGQVSVCVCVVCEGERVREGNARIFWLVFSLNLIQLVSVG